MTYTEAIGIVRHEILKKKHEIDSLKECIKHLENDSALSDELTQMPEQTLENFGLVHCRVVRE